MERVMEGPTDGYRIARQARQTGLQEEGRVWWGPEMEKNRITGDSQETGCFGHKVGEQRDEK